MVIVRDLERRDVAITISKKLVQYSYILNILARWAISRNFPSILREMLQTALNKFDRWATK